MALKSLNRFGCIRAIVGTARKIWLQYKFGIKFGRGVSVSLSSRFISRNRGMIIIGDDTLVAFKTLLYTYNNFTGEELPIKIGSRCFIGGGSMITPGVVIGDECIVGGGAVVYDDVPDRSIVGGNPARVLRSNIEVGRFGRLKGADENSRRMWVNGD